MFCTNPECPDLQECGIPGEYVDGIVRCPVCGSALVPELTENGPRTEPLTAEDVEPVFETAEPTEAEVARSILTGAGIPFLIQGQDPMVAFRAGHAGFRFHPLGGAIRFVVPVDKAEEARILLTEMECDAHDREDASLKARIEVIEQYRGWTPPVSLQKSVERLLSAAPQNAVAGLSAVVLSNAGGLNRERRRRKTRAMRRSRGPATF